MKYKIEKSENGNVTTEEGEDSLKNLTNRQISYIKAGYDTSIIPYRHKSDSIYNVIGKEKAVCFSIDFC